MFLYCTGLLTTPYCPCHTMANEYNELIQKSDIIDTNQIIEKCILQCIYSFFKSITTRI